MRGRVITAVATLAVCAFAVFVFIYAVDIVASINDIVLQS